MYMLTLEEKQEQVKRQREQERSQIQERRNKQSGRKPPIQSGVVSAVTAAEDERSRKPIPRSPTRGSVSKDSSLSLSGSSPSSKPESPAPAANSEVSSQPTNEEISKIKKQIMGIVKVQNSMKKKSDVLKNIKDELEIIQSRLVFLRDERGEGKVPRNGYAEIEKVKDLIEKLEDSQELKSSTDGILEITAMQAELKKIRNGLRNKLTLSGGTRRKKRKARRTRRT
jgi:hypothetical protein